VLGASARVLPLRSGRIEEGRLPAVDAGEGLLITDASPDPSRLGLALGRRQYRHWRVVCSLPGDASPVAVAASYSCARGVRCLRDNASRGLPARTVWLSHRNDAKPRRRCAIRLRATRGLVHCATRAQALAPMPPPAARCAIAPQSDRCRSFEAQVGASHASPACRTCRTIEGRKFGYVSSATH
jgi:hypothetical protein